MTEHRPQPVYKKRGFKGVWRWASGHGLKRWLKARNWARRRGYGPQARIYNKKVKWFREHQEPSPPPGHKTVVAFDGKPCAHWIAKILGDARRSGIWKGVLLSGQRTPEHSEELCFQICGKPSCPGLCAGRSSNHCCPPSFKCSYPEGAADVTDPAGLDAFCRSHGRGLIGNGRVLPNDINHFSHRGN